MTIDLSALPSLAVDVLPEAATIEDV